MKKLTSAVVAVLVTAAIAVGVASGADRGGTVIATGFGCQIWNGDGTTFFTNNSVATHYSNQQGSKIVVQCQAIGIPAPSLTFYTGANTGLCYVFGLAPGCTFDWSDKVGYNGSTQLTITWHDVDANAAAAALSSAGVSIGG